jgi:hypothetical protein
MILVSGVDILSVVEPILLGIGLFVLIRRRAYSDFPAFCGYLVFRVVIYAALSLLLHGAHMGLIERHLAYKTYYFIYWIGYLAGAGIAFFVIQEVFLHLMAPLAGLRRLGLIAFRWVVLTSVLIAAVLSMLPAGSNRNLLISATSGVMRSMSVLELCLVAFIALSMQSLQIPLRSRDVGVALGLAMVASADLFGSAFAFGGSNISSAANYSCQLLAILAIGVWIAYFLRPEPEKAPIMLPATSPLLRWNEIANALGHPPPQVALGTSSDFFLEDVEKAVDKVLKKNLANPAR